ncbi:hypothetical protein G7050_12455 [Dysgonomonas sp. HDW5A]|uniref:hypothetical protein n=1 Tax=Dysgonomonas sp. HDW5A TaxID=2714926 RepID=UPI0014084DC9|nr:hypothetical protein [Dysgonomonas sp. HDW5A]QIK58303.1 hypothetical protein G7050_12455 [Dysgonomonas sp. HDW5A]
MLRKLSEAIRKKPIIGWGLFLAVMVGGFLLGLLAAYITERRAEIELKVSNLFIYNNESRVQNPAFFCLKIKICREGAYCIRLFLLSVGVCYTAIQ